MMLLFLEIYMKYVDESTGIDLFAEMERDEKTYLDGKNYHLKRMQYKYFFKKIKLVFLVLKI